jgi:hypothetical protein
MEILRARIYPQNLIMKKRSLIAIALLSGSIAFAQQKKDLLPPPPPPPPVITTIAPPPPPPPPDARTGQDTKGARPVDSVLAVPPPPPPKPSKSNAKREQ